LPRPSAEPSPIAGSTHTSPSADERREELLSMVNEQGYASVAALAARFAVTEMTIRRDIRFLADAGHVRRVHGGASKADDGPGTPFGERATTHSAQKAAIAREAVALLKPRTVVALDSGTTVSAVPAVIGEAHTPLTIVTHSVPVMAALARNGDVTVIGLGGQLHTDTQSFYGPATRAGIADLTIDTLLLAASGVTPDGLHCATPHDAETKQALMGRAQFTILLVGSEKIGVGAAVRVAPLSAVDVIITDGRLTGEQESVLRAAAPATRIVRAGA
jgi:DeoR/GlpR family transcriptional regulator of sugar metabolism